MDIATLEINVRSGSAVRELDNYTRATRNVTRAEDERHAAEIRAARANIEQVQRTRQMVDQTRALQTMYASAGRSLGGYTTQQRAAAQAASQAAVAIGAAAAATRANSVAAAGATVNFGKLRGVMTTVTASALSAVPGVTQLTSILGTMAFGSGPMVLILAGVAALALAWRALTRDAREAKQATKELLEEVKRVGEQGSRGFLGNLPQLRTAADIKRSDIELQRVEFLQERRRALGLAKGTGEQAIIAALGTLDRKRYDKLVEDYTKYGQYVESIDRQIAERRSEEDERVHREREAAAATALQARLHEIGVEGRERILWAQLEQRARMGHGIGQLRLPARNVTTIQSRNTLSQQTSFGIIRAVEPVTAAGRRAAGMGGGFFGGLQQQVAGMFDPSQIASGLATGGISTAVSFFGGQIKDFVGNMLFGGQRAKEAARLMKQAMADFSRSVELELAVLRGDTRRAAELSGIGNIVGKLKELSFVRDSKLPSFASMNELIKFMEQQMQLSAFSKLTAEQQQAWKDLITLAKELGLSFDKLNTTLTEVLTNIPTGWKIDLARFRASEGRPFTPASSGTATSAGFTNNGTITVVANDPDEFMRKLQRRQFVRSGTIAGPLRA